MADLKVSSIALDDAAKQLKSILDELKNMDAKWEDGAIWGHPTVKGAMDEFIGSWWVKRENLQDDLEDLQKKMEQSAETWNGLEVELANSLESDEN